MQALLGFNAASIGMTLLGGLAPTMRNVLSRRGMLRMFSLRSGILLSAAFTEVLPEAWAMDSSVASWGALAAFALLFLGGNFAMLDSCPEYLEQCSVHVLSASALAALFLHALIDGFNLTVAFSAGALAGTAVGLALALHKLADGFTLTTLLRQSGYARRTTLLALCGIALATPAGSVLSHWELSSFTPELMAGLLGFSGGSFVYIAAADILPRLHKAGDKSNILYFGLGLISVAALRGLH